MKTLFPPDVKVVTDGDIGTDSDLYGYAFKAFRIAQRRQSISGASHITTSFPVGKDAQVTATIEGPIKTVWIERVKPTSRPTPQRTPEEVPTSVGSAKWLMLSGTFRNVNGTATWHPTRYTAAANDISYSWRPLNRLAGHAGDLYYVKSSMFTGIMPRVVQAVYGVGNVKDESREYLTEQPFNTGFAHRPLRYMAEWGTTHGVVKTGDQNHWLVEISRRGVLAMPLPLFASTTTAEYRAYVKKKKDTGSQLVLDEFGGIPSGENFPADDTLVAQYIGEGKIVRLMTANGMESGFYENRTSWYSSCGWDFNDIGTQAVNTARGYIAPDLKTYSSGTLDQTANNYLYSDYCTLRLQLSAHDVNQLKISQPVGTGSATLSRQHRGFLVDGNRYDFFLPTLTNGRTENPDIPEGQYLTSPENDDSMYLWVPISDGLWENGVELVNGHWLSYKRWVGPGTGEIPPFWGPGPVGSVHPRYGAYLHVFHRQSGVERVKVTPRYYAAIGGVAGAIIPYYGQDDVGYCSYASSETRWEPFVTSDSVETRIVTNGYGNNYLSMTRIIGGVWVESESRIPYENWSYGAPNSVNSWGKAFCTFPYGVRSGYTMTTWRVGQNWSVFYSRQLGYRPLTMPFDGWVQSPPVFDASISAGTPPAYIIDGHLNDGVDPHDQTSTTADLRRTLYAQGIPNGAGRLFPHQVNWTGAA
jgi:hypothetical protein